MSSKWQYYNVLGISPDASHEDMRSAFRRLAFKYHPDRSNEVGAEERFKEIVEAYQVLSDSIRHSNSSKCKHQPKSRTNLGFNKVSSDLGRIFEDFFEGVAPAQSPTSKHEDDIQYHLSITFEEAFHGCEKIIVVERLRDCPICHRRDTNTVNLTVKCPECRGSGTVKQMRQGVFGRFVNMVICHKCKGDGYLNSQLCSECQGTNRVVEKASIQVSLPPGVEDGSLLFLEGQGNNSNKGHRPGGLYISLSILPHSFLTRQGQDVICDLSVEFTQAALGREVEVPIVGGTFFLKIPPGTQSGTVFRLNGKGFPSVNGSRYGDQVVRVQVTTPQNLSQDQREILHKLAESLSHSKRSIPSFTRVR
ncbi:MAG: DnaJ C-terminal domain-containing protein [Chloroflexota bacterium]|nr:DnaJ C-terminal domain-containing protein [Chloroflexota bacterium]